MDCTEPLRQLSLHSRQASPESAHVPASPRSSSLGQAEAGEDAGATPGTSDGSDPSDLRLVGSRLQDLPHDLLHSILRLAGRPTRLVCRAFYRAHGPLTGGLHLTVGGCQDLLRDTTTARTTSLDNIHTLVISRPFYMIPPDILQALPSILLFHLPALQSLRISPSSVLKASTLAALAPLSRSLTQISHATLDLPALSALTSALPSLHSLHLWLEGDTVLDALALLKGGLPHLLDLKLACRPYATPTATTLLSSLAGGLPHLTRLSLAPALKEWDQEAAACLASAWPQLADLTIAFEDDPEPKESSSDESSGNGWLSSDDGLSALPMGAAAALAQHAALTRLCVDACDTGEWDQLQALPLRELSASSFGMTPQVHWAVAVAAEVSSITRLVLYDDHLWLDRNLADHLSRMHDRLLSLELRIRLPSWRALAQLSCLSRLQDLFLQEQYNHQDVDSAGIVEQAASVLAAGLQELRYLFLQLDGDKIAMPALMAGLSAHSRLREVHQWPAWSPLSPVQLAPVAGLLVRLSMPSPSTSVALVISTLQGMRRLHWLHLQVFCSYGKRDDDEPRQVLLPPRLRVLVVDMQQVEEEVRGVLQEAAGRQECMILDQAVPAKWDDCGGYEEGASLQWLRKHGRL